MQLDLSTSRSWSSSPQTKLIS